jgi:hypothetical protein
LTGYKKNCNFSPKQVVLAKWNWTTNLANLGWTNQRKRKKKKKMNTNNTNSGYQSTAVA